MSTRRPAEPARTADMRDLYGARAARAFAAMQSGFWTRAGEYRRDGRLHRPRAAAHLWPFSRALVATLDLAGVERDFQSIDAGGAIAESVGLLERYWDPTADPPAYSSDVRGTRIGGDRYYDDNAWIGLALVQHERMYPGSGLLDRAEDLFRFAVSGWDRHDVVNPGGVFWVEQGRGIGARNHDRNTVSNAPNAELGLHLRELRGRSPADPSDIGAEEMYEWVLATLDASRDTDAPATGLFYDKVQGDGTLDKRFWTYNQGSMVGANVLLARLHQEGRDEYLYRAEAIARKALRYFAPADFDRQPPAFNAIFFRNLLLLHPVVRDAELKTDIIEHIRRYTDEAWSHARDRRDRFHLPDGGVTLLNQSAMVQLLALLAWDPAQYGKLA